MKCAVRRSRLRPRSVVDRKVMLSGELLEPIDSSFLEFGRSAQFGSRTRRRLPGDLIEEPIVAASTVAETSSAPRWLGCGRGGAQYRSRSNG